MPDLTSIIGHRVDRIIYQAPGVVSVVLTDELTSKRCSINLIGCFHYEDTGISGLSIENTGESILGVNLSEIARYQGLEVPAHKQLWIKSKSTDSRKRELVAGCTAIDVSEDVNKYAPE